ncbi:hypothetical protein PFISCL1PPCAC_4771, partial [Pristionchus fissidentatus]
GGEAAVARDTADVARFSRAIRIRSWWSPMDDAVLCVAGGGGGTRGPREGGRGGTRAGRPLIVGERGRNREKSGEE